MISTLKETVLSIQNPKYGEIIINKTLKSVFWYWAKYLMIVIFIPLTLLLIVLTRFLPEVPKLIETKLPEGVLSLKDKTLSSTISQPQLFKESNFTILFDLEASPSAIENIDDGIVITKTELITKSSDGGYQIQDYSSVPEFSLDKYQLADWVKDHRHQIWAICLVAILVIFLITFILMFIYQFFIFQIWTTVFWIINKVFLKKNLSYINLLKIIIFGSVLRLLLSLLLFFFPNDLLSLLNTGIFVFFVFTWINSFPPTVIPQLVPTSKLK